MLRSIALLLSVSLAASLPTPNAAASTTITEYLALAPQPPSTVLKWTQISYPSDLTKASDVQVSFLNSTVPEVGGWYNLDTKLGVQLSAKVLGESIYAYVAKAGSNSSEGGCCADTFRIFAKSDGSFRDIDLYAIVTKALPGLDAHASHTFDVKELNGKTIAFAMVAYTEPELDGAPGDAIVAFDVADGSLIQTADGKDAFNIFREAGETLSGQDASAAIFKIQYFNGTVGEEWHGNGVEHIVAKDGTNLLAITHRSMSEAVIFKSPYDYKTSAGGGAILQRFGTPKQYTSKTQTYHYFGVEETGAMGSITGGVHNVWYRTDSEAFPGKETISMFVNTASGTNKAYAVEFVLNLQEQQAGKVYDDTVFKTDYKAAELSFSAPAQGGARAIGDGVFLVMSGVAGPGLEVADVSGSNFQFQYPVSSGRAPNLYDPFCFVPKAK